MRRKILTYSNKVVIKEKSISKYFSKSESFQNEYLANQYVAPLGISPVSYTHLTLPTIA